MSIVDRLGCADLSGTASQQLFYSVRQILFLNMR